MIKFGIHPVQVIHNKPINGIFFTNSKQILFNNTSQLQAFENLKKGSHLFFDKYFYFDSEHPNWHKNYFNNKISKYRNLNWWKIPDFDLELGDIKNLWELSRFDWVVQLSKLAANGDKRALNLLNSRLNNWIEENPFYKGVNWKCGQEASIRIIHLMLSSIILNQFKQPTDPFIKLIEAHVKRIAPTINYAISQNNNHGTSEAAALFVAGHFLTSNGLTEYKHLEVKGRKWLEDRAKVLFSKDGCFSQYSINYHRLALDTYSFCEIYRCLYELKPFKNQLYDKIKKAIIWLEILTDSESGDTPNIGANDGAMILNLFNCGYRDYRDSVQLANLLFNNRLIYPINDFKAEIYKLFRINIENVKIDTPTIKSLIRGDKDGFFIYKNKKLLLVFKRPIFKFRPSHSDALHIDLWVNGQNIFRDGGTFSYNTTIDKTKYYNGTESHNTIQFDIEDQMPKISRFLFGSWLKESLFEFYENENEISIKSGYINNLGIKHEREVIVNNDTINVIDDINGFKKEAKLIWRLNLSNWQLIDNKNSNLIEIDINKKTINGKVSVVNAFESRYYLNESEIPAIFKFLNYSGQFKTIIKY